MSATMRGNFATPTFLATSLVLLLILFIRVTRGLDLTDEMQYYGEIKGLIETGRLFSNDLFIQQSVYILLYPAFSIYHSIFGFEGLVFFGRLLMAALSIAVFLYAYRKLLEFKFSFLVASLTALSLTFAIPYHGIFAPSYNTISQVLWIIFALRFFEWKQRSPISWAVIPIITAFAHPTSAVMMALLVFARLLTEREFAQMGKLALVFLGGAIIALPLALYFAPLQEYFASLTFSSGYGVGESFLSSKYQPIALLIIYVMFGSCLLIGERLQKVPFALLASIFITFVIVMFAADSAGVGYSRRIVLVFSSLSALSYCWILSNCTRDDATLRLRTNWLVLLLLAYATTLGVTSGNGIGQSTGAFMVGLPLLLGIAVTNSFHNAKSVGSSFIKVGCVFLVTLLFVVHWSRFAYREDGWWNTNEQIGSVSEFQFINTSLERADFIHRMQQALGQTIQGKRSLIISEYPVLYFALDTIPETCMLYMHSVTSDKSEKTLLECFEKKSPQIIVDISIDKGVPSEGSRIKRVMRNYYLGKRYDCNIDSMRFRSDGNYNPTQLKISVCKQTI